MEFIFTNLPELKLIYFTIIVIGIGGILRGFMGFGPALLTIPVLAFIYSPTEALVIHIIMEIPSTLYLLPSAIKNSQKKEMTPMFIAMILSIPLGMYLVVSLDPQIMRRIISIIVLFLVFLLARGWKLKTFIGLKTMTFSGFLGGFIQGAAGMGGPPIVAVLLSRDDNPDISRGNVMLLMAGIVIFSIASQSFYGLMTLKLITLGLSASPIYMLTTYFGSRFYSSSGRYFFKKLALIFLATIAITTLIASFN